MFAALPVCPVFLATAPAVPPDFFLTPTFWLSLLAAFFYALGALLLKRTATGAIDVWRITFVSNIATSLALAGLWGFGGQVPSSSLLWQPAVVALLFIAGQITAILALTRGDVSVATPMLGLKILMVAFFTWLLLHEPLPPRVWAAATMATLAVALLGISRDRAGLHRAAFTGGCTLIAAAAYACFDVLVQRWSPAWGVGRFPPIMGAFAAVYSLVLIPKFRQPLRSVPGPIWPYLGFGSALIGLQGLLIISTIANWGYAAAANVVYSSRGLWSVLLVLCLGHWFAQDEHALGRKLLLFRLVGAVLLTAAILLLVY